eukprot:TRINITY_DN1870_c2_g1_i2.p1 TRINITY_DN1870_c2_g1~~TRINITY_DN1870_c2_g1_i2.p1  ORF type:complete len:255 (-),score=61.68 TRINITY_DN1870_c2_g1_i2:651-1415(-)
MEEAVAAFIEKTEHLLKLEVEAENEEFQHLKETYSEEVLAKRGICLRKLTVESTRTGLGGRSLIKLKSNKPDHPLTAHKFTVGDIVSILPTKFSKAELTKGKPVETKSSDVQQGVIFKVTQFAITVAYSEVPDEVSESGPLSLHMMGNEVTWKRLNDALANLRNGIGGKFDPETHRLCEVLFGISPPLFAHQTSFVPKNSGLNASQIDAVEFALAANDLALIHGPPGTGKTTTLVEFILQSVIQGKKNFGNCRK